MASTEQSPIGLTLDTSGLAESLKGAAASIEDNLVSPATQSAQTLSAAFERTFQAMESAIAKAAQNGTLSVSTMVDTMLSDLSRLAFDQLVEQPLASFLGSAVKNLFSFGGARATGGPVSASQAYLVGERGPELFVPAGAGSIDPMTQLKGGGATINFNVTTPDAPSFARSEAQITAMLARAVARGRRGL